MSDGTDSDAADAGAPAGAPPAASPDAGTAPDAGASPDAGTGTFTNTDGGASLPAAVATGSTDDAGASPDDSSSVCAAKSDADTNTCSQTDDSPQNQILTVSCSHSGRQSGDANRLQVVPTATVQAGNQFGPVTTTGQSGGTDSINAVVQQNGTNPTPPTLAVSGPTSNSVSATTLQFNADSPASPGLWTASFQPVIYTVTSTASDGSSLSVSVEAFPSDQNTISVKLDSLSAELKSWVSSLQTTLQNILGDAQLTADLCNGTITGSIGWKENSDWQAYYGYNIQVGFNPLFGMSLKVPISIIEWMPAPIRNNVGDIDAYSQWSGAITLNGSVASTSPTGTQVSGGASGSVTVAIGIEAHAGSQNILSVSVSASAQTTLQLTGTLYSDNVQGIGVNYELTLNALTLSVSCNTKSGVVDWFNSTQSDSYTPWPSVSLVKKNYLFFQ